MGPYTIANWGVVLNFLRVRPGSEKNVVARLRRADPQSRFYWCFGHYDILHLKLIEGSSHLPSPPSDPDIYQAVLLTTLGWQGPFCTPHLGDWPEPSGATVTLLKLNPAALEEVGMELELQTLGYLSDNISPYTLASLGHSEIVMFRLGGDLSVLLEGVTGTSTLTVADVLRDRRGTECGSRSLFTKSHTIPLASFRRVVHTGEFNELRGMIEPVLRISCRPGAEPGVVQSLPADPAFDTAHVYGRYDLRIRYRFPVLAGDYLRSLLEFRGSMANTTDLHQTVTDLFRGNDGLRQQSSDGLPIKPIAPQGSEAFKSAAILRSYLRNLNLPENLRRMLAEFEARYVACEADQYVSTEYRDMQGFIHHLAARLAEALRDLEKGRYTHFHNRINDLESQLGVATDALYQRYASVEAHLQGVSFPVFASSVGLNRVIAAASRIVQRVYDHAFLARYGTIWEGYVCFWDGSFRCAAGDIHSFPADKALAPLAWDALTHELGHGAWRASQSRPRMTERLLREVFAQWFDFHYFHPELSAAQFVLRAWRSWIKVPRVWLDKRHYLLRSLLVYCLSEKQSLRDALGDRYKVVPFVRGLRERMVNMLTESVPGFDQYVSGSSPEIDWLWIEGTAVKSGMPFLLDQCEDTHDPYLRGRINRGTGKADRQAEQILLGRVVTGGIGNPLRVIKTLASLTDADNFAVSMALIFSLAYDFRSAQARRVEPRT